MSEVVLWIISGGVVATIAALIAGEASGERFDLAAILYLTLLGFTIVGVHTTIVILIERFNLV